jgi:hypothetical protein
MVRQFANEFESITGDESGVGPAIRALARQIERIRLTERRRTGHD